MEEEDDLHRPDGARPRAEEERRRRLRQVAGSGVHFGGLRAPILVGHGHPGPDSGGIALRPAQLHDHGRWPVLRAVPEGRVVTRCP